MFAGAAHQRARSQSYGVAIRADGKILAGGVSGCCGSYTRLAIARYLGVSARLRGIAGLVGS